MAILSSCVVDRNHSGHHAISAASASPPLGSPRHPRPAPRREGGERAQGEGTESGTFSAPRRNGLVIALHLREPGPQTVAGGPQHYPLTNRRRAAVGPSGG